MEEEKKRWRKKSEGKNFDLEIKLSNFLTMGQGPIYEILLKKYCSKFHYKIISYQSKCSVPNLSQLTVVMNK